MSDLYYSTNLTNDVTLCIAPLTDQQAAAAGPEIIANPLGYFLYQHRASSAPDELEVIARVVNAEAAWRLSRILNME